MPAYPVARLPKYHRLAEELRRRIESGELAPGDQIPSNQTRTSARPRRPPASAWISGADDQNQAAAKTASVIMTASTMGSGAIASEIRENPPPSRASGPPSRPPRPGAAGLLIFFEFEAPMRAPV